MSNGIQESYNGLRDRQAYALRSALECVEGTDPTDETSSFFYWKREFVNAVIAYLVFDNTTFCHERSDNTPYTGPDFNILRNRALSLFDGALKVHEGIFNRCADRDQVYSELKLWLSPAGGSIRTRIVEENYK